LYDFNPMRMFMFRRIEWSSFGLTLTVCCWLYWMWSGIFWKQSS
jgi:hypothetical protein